MGANNTYIAIVDNQDNSVGKLVKYDGGDIQLSTMSDKQREYYAIHLMNAHDKYDATTKFRKNRDRLIGKKLTNDNGIEMPVAQYKHMIYGEGKKVENIIRNVLKEYIYKDRKIIIF
jgi:hypothetical protein